jgi:hypothetical protein
MRGDNEPLRLVAAVALARLGDPLGRDAVQRMAYHADPIVRRQAALVLGELEDMTNVATLVSLLDDRPAVCSAAMESLTKVVGRNMAEVEGQPPANTSEQIRRWKEWFDRQQAEAAGKQTVVSWYRIGMDASACEPSAIVLLTLRVRAGPHAEREEYVGWDTV